jgi:hypothetical protein
LRHRSDDVRGLLLLLLALCSGGVLAAAPADDARQLLLMLRTPAVHDSPEAGYVGDYRNAPGREARARIVRGLAADHHLALRTDWPMPALGVDCFVLEARDEQAAMEAIDVLARDPRVESVQALQQFDVLGASTKGGDPLYPAQPAGAAWKLQALHTVATGRGITVAMIDSGVDASHADLRGQIAESRDFVADDNGKRVVPEMHGTEVAGLIAARADNALGIAGVAPGAKLLALRACWQSDASGRARCNSFTLAKAMQFAIDRRAHVINLSLGGPRDPLLARLVEVAIARGATVVAAVDPRATDGGFPASLPGVVAVAGTERVVPFRAFLAPADALPTTTVDGGWGLVGGTSFAAAQVSGLVALLREGAPRLKGAAVGDALAPAPALGSVAARPLPIDACAAFARAGPRCACGCRLADTQETPRH